MSIQWPSQETRLSLKQAKFGTDLCKQRCKLRHGPETFEN